MQRHWIKLSCVLCVMWLGSLALPAAEIRSEPQNWTFGIKLLLFGWLGVVQFQFGWVANLLFWPALLISAGKYMPPKLGSRALFIAILACTTSAVRWRQVLCDGGPCDVIGFGVGFYLWLAATLMMSVLALFRSELNELFEDVI